MGRVLFAGGAARMGDESLPKRAMPGKLLEAIRDAPEARRPGERKIDGVPEKGAKKNRH